MFRLPSEEALRDAFRPRDQQALLLPADAAFPQFVRSYWAWLEPSGAWLFLVFALRGGPATGIAFRRAPPAPGGMCEWCHTFGPASGVSLLTANRNSRKRAGIYVCADLDCQTRAEDAALRAGRSPLDAVQALLERMGRFAEQGLGIDLRGGGRNLPAAP
jgi:hypothetical protein